MILGVAGYPPNELGGFAPCAWHEWVKQQLRVALQQLAPTQVIAGVTLGTAQWACELASELRIPYVAVVPFETYHRRWPPAVQLHYQQVLRAACKRVLLTQGAVQGAHGVRQAMLRCNRYIVARSTDLLVVWDAIEEESFTADAVGYARALDHAVHAINPRDLGIHGRRAGFVTTGAASAHADDDIPF